MYDIGNPITTFCIVGYDPQGPSWGIAIASRFLAVGGQTCWGAPGAGVIAVLAHLNTNHGRDGIPLLKNGLDAETVMGQLLSQDPQRNLRQTAIVDTSGGVATHTGRDCTPWAGGVSGRYCAAQGNMLLNGAGCEAMVKHFVSSSGSLARRLVDALTLGDEKGGDFRGRQAAALYVICPPFAEPSASVMDPIINLRVDDHANPFMELERLLDLWELMYLPATPEEQWPLECSVIRRYQQVLAKLNYYGGQPNGILDDLTSEGLSKLSVMQNLRRRLVSPKAWIDGRLLEHLESKLGLSPNE